MNAVINSVYCSLRTEWLFTASHITSGSWWTTGSRRPTAVNLFGARRVVITRVARR